MLYFANTSPSVARLNSSYFFDHFELRANERLLLREGEAVNLGPRTFDFLLCLVSNHTRVLSKDELLQTVWPGMVVEENNLTVQTSALRKLLGSQAISTITGRGYQFSLPVRQTQVPLVPKVQKHSTIAVLPFKVLGEQTELRFLAEGLLEDVTALLARVPGFLVISQASTQMFDHSSIALPEIAEQLQVQFVVLGSIRRVGEIIRVNVQLAEAQTGQVLWNSRFECSPNSSADLQEEIARGLLSELEPALNKAEIAQIRRQRPNNLDAWAHYHEATGALAQLGWSESGLRNARHQLENSIEIDSNFGLAHAHLALLTALSRNIGLLPHSDEVLVSGLTAANTAIELDAGNSEVMGYAGCALCDLGQTRQGLITLKAALQLNPSNAQAQVAHGAALVLMKELEGGIAQMRLGMRISPKDRRLGFWLWILSCFLLRANRPEEALEEAIKAVQHDTRFHLAHVAQAASLDKLGNAPLAQQALIQARTVRPGLSVEEIAISHGKKIAARMALMWQT